MNSHLSFTDIPFLRCVCSDKCQEVAIFLTPHVFDVTQFGFHPDLWLQKLESTGYLQHRLHDPVFSCFHRTLSCYGQTDTGS